MWNAVNLSVLFVVVFLCAFWNLAILGVDLSPFTTPFIVCIPGLCFLVDDGVFNTLGEFLDVDVVSEFLDEFLDYIGNWRTLALADGTTILVLLETELAVHGTLDLWTFLFGSTFA